MASKTKSPQTENIRHSLAHLLAAAVLKKFPKAKLGIGPTIENGFYYDFLLPQTLTPDDLKELEQTMRGFIKQNLPFSGRKLTPVAAKKLFTDQPFKLDLIKEFAKTKEPLSIYITGAAPQTATKTFNSKFSTLNFFIDLCRGGHVKNTKEINPEAFKLDKIAGAYWRGDEKNPQLQRIYGVAFKTKKELDKFLKIREEAGKRDHKVLGPRLGIFMFHETAPGMPYWLPKGMILLNELIDFWREEHRERGYHEIASPLINKKELWEISGHWEHYKKNMFIAAISKKEVYGVKAMNCPNAMVVFGSAPRSYRDLPLRLSDTDILHRYELSGTLNGLLRVRSFRQDDSHNFVTEGQIKEEYGQILDIARKFYDVFGLDYHLRLGTRPEKFMGDVKTWNKAEAALKQILDEKAGKGKYTVLEGDGAFYGPKIDIIMKDALGREWQMGTIQLDFQQPRRFKLEYTDRDGKKKTPVVIHRVIYGSLDRFIGILTEHFAGAFPLWLSPVQAEVINVGSGQRKYAAEVYKKLKAAGIRTSLSDENLTVGKRIRDAEIMKVPYILVVGEKEVANKTVNVRHYRRGQEGEVKTEKLLELIKKEVENKVI